ncbi:MAG: hypothetical protein AB1898_02050, partial [Acidobacteriota bacterium]
LHRLAISIADCVLRSPFLTGSGGDQVSASAIHVVNRCMRPFGVRRRVGAFESGIAMPHSKMG